VASATVGILRVLLTANTAEFDAAMAKASGQATRWSKDLAGIGRQASQIGQSLTTSLTLPILGVGVAAIKTGMEFEGVMNSIQGVLRPTAAQMDAVRATAIKMGADTAFSATEAADAILELGKAGFETDTAIASVDKVLQLAAASGLSMGDSAALAARALNAFGLEAKDLNRVNDVLAAAVNKSSLEIGDMQVAFGYIGPVARGFGLSIETVSSALAIMRDRGVAAETTGRALREGLSRLANPVKSVADVVAELGLQLRDVNPETHSLAEIVGTLQGKGLTAAQALKLFGDAAGPGMYALVQNGKQGLEQLTAELTNSTGAAGEMANAMMHGLPGAMERLKGSVETAWLSISRAIEPVVIRVADVIGALADLITNYLVPAFLSLPGPIQTGAIALVAVSAAIGPLLWGFGQVATAASAVIGAFGTTGLIAKSLAVILPSVGTAASGAAIGVTALRLALAGLGVGVAITALGLLVTWLTKTEQQADRTAEALDRVDSRGVKVMTLEEGAAAAKKMAESMQGLGIGLHVTGEGAARVIPRIREVGDATGQTGEKVKDATRDLREFYNWVGERQMEAAAEAMRAQEAFRASVTRTTTAFPPFQAAVKSTGDEVRALGGSMEDLISSTFAEYSAAQTKATQEALAWAQANGAVLAPSIQQVSAASLLGATETVGVWGRTMAGLPQVIQSAIQGGGSVIAAAGAHIGTSMMTAFSEKFGPAIKAALPFGIGNAVTALLPVLGSLFGPVAEKIGDFFRNIFGGPSKDERAGRALVADFEKDLAASLTATQAAEAGTEAWKKTVIALRDAYIAQGRTEEEALADAKRLWESSKQGAEASRQVIEDIQRKLDGLPSEKAIDVTVRYNEEGAAPGGPTHTGQPVGAPAEGPSVSTALPGGWVPTLETPSRAAAVVAGGAGAGAGGGSLIARVPLVVDGRTFAEAFVEYVPQALRRAGI